MVFQYCGTDFQLLVLPVSLVYKNQLNEISIYNFPQFGI